ncbi:MAG: energy-coupling factor ABC transporter ATP-binding protein [Candidatus Methanomethyliaceae archaeon]|nr:energy-coupling factor ABC transporter ATP-binding protein [Candidatus Methanomethyliaceae archaeon]MDW7970689.1 ABC transporter ATP-binding protein [Nitrososphaerota archaeon]
MIEFKGVYFSYVPGEYVIKNINLFINRGEILAILGGNGAGKTTLVKHINGLLKPQLGYVKVLGMNTKEVSVAKLAKQVGLVFQNPDHQLFAETVEKEVMFALINFGFPPEEIKSRTEKILRGLDLIEYKDRSPFTLSGGEKKRLALAAVLCYDPSIIILDEPTTGQDYNQKRNLAKLLKRFNEEGKTIIIVTHDIEFVADFIPRCIIMSNGEIVADGPSDDILTRGELLMANKLLMPQLVEICYELSINPPSIKFDVVLSKVRAIMKGEI